MTSSTGDCQVAAYYFPNYHPDPRNDAWHGTGWTEWEVAQCARPRFEGHVQPKVPLWGYQDESQPAVMQQKTEAAAKHGVDAFIFDWYWYEDGPYLNRALDEGFLKIPDTSGTRFAIMWANHDWIEIHPWKYKAPQPCLAPGRFSPAAWERATDHVAEHYFTHPACWTIDGRAYFSIYEIDKLIESLGGFDATKKAIERLDAKAREAGLDGLHFNAVFWKIPVLPGESVARDPGTLMAALGCSSVTSYVWVHHFAPAPFPHGSYADLMKKSVALWPELAAKFTMPYYPNVTMGWDSSPRACQSDRFENIGYPFTAVLEDNTPANFQWAIEQAKAYLAQRPPAERILTINAWNEWTEGSYLEPDTVNGYAYLEAIRAVFG